MLVFEFRAYAKSVQFTAIDDAIRTVQFVRNKAIRYWMDGHGKSVYDLNKYCAVLAREFPFAKELNSMARQAAAERAWALVRAVSQVGAEAQRTRGELARQDALEILRAGCGSLDEAPCAHRGRLVRIAVRNGRCGRRAQRFLQGGVGRACHCALRVRGNGPESKGRPRYGTAVAGRRFFPCARPGSAPGARPRTDTP